MSTDSFGSVLQYRSISLMRVLTTSGSCLGCFAGFEGLATAADEPAASDRRAMPSSISNATPTAASRPDRARPRTVERRAEVESRGVASSGRDFNESPDPGMLGVTRTFANIRRGPRRARASAPSLGQMGSQMASCCAGSRPSAPVKKESWLAFLTRPFVGKAEEEAPAATDSLEEPSLDSDQQAMTGGEWRRADRWGEGGVYAQAAKLVKLEDADSLEQLKQLLPKLKELDRKEPQQGARDAVSSPKPKPEPEPEHQPEH